MDERARSDEVQAKVDMTDIKSVDEQEVYALSAFYFYSDRMERGLPEKQLK